MADQVIVVPTPINPVQIKGAIAFNAEHARIWAEGTDEQVEELGGEHSAKGWAEATGEEGRTYTDQKVAQATQELTAEINRQSLNTLSQSESYTDASVRAEAGLRAEADSNLQTQIDAITASSDVTDIVGTYAELQAYDTTHLKDGDIIKVLSDSTHDNSASYYRWDKNDSEFDYIGSEGPYYTKAEADTEFLSKSDASSTYLTQSSAASTYATQSSLTSGLATKQNTLTTGTGISISSDTISGVAMTGATGSVAGTSGLVPAPAATDDTKFLKGDGTWGDIDALPSQTGQSGKFLTTDGTDASWASVSVPSNTYTEDNLVAGDNVEFVKQSYRLNCNVQGSPTITDGVASGFSDSNYLWHSNWLTAATTSFDVFTAVKLNAAATDNFGIIDAGDGWGLRLTTSTNNTARLRIITAPQTSASVDITGTTPLTAGTKVYIKASYNSTDGYKLYTSSDGETWNLEGSSSITSTPNNTTNYKIGDNAATGIALNGSIYLQDTYINIDGTKIWTAYVAAPVTVINSSGLKNTAGGANSLTLLGTATTAANAVNIGYQAETSAQRGIALGYRALASGQDAVAIGSGSESSTTTRTTAYGQGSVAIGQYTRAEGERGTALGMGASAGAYGATSVGQFAYATAQYAIQIGQGINPTANTLSVGLSSSNNYRLLDSNGKIPAARLPSMAPTLTWYTGNEGTTVTISNTSSAALVKVYKNGVLLQPTQDYSISGTTLTLVTALVSTDKITTEVF